MKNEVKTFYFEDHIRTWSSPWFPVSVRPAASRVFPNLALQVKSLPTPGLCLCQCFSYDGEELMGAFKTGCLYLWNSKA